MRKYIIGIIALVIAVVISAFNAKFNSSLPWCESPNAWFKYVGPSFRSNFLDPLVSLGTLRNPANYTLIYFPESYEACDDVTYLCAICAPIDPYYLNRPLINNTPSLYEMYDFLETYHRTGTPPVFYIVEKTNAND